MSLPTPYQRKPFNRKKEKLHKTNEEITAPEVRITGDGIESHVCSIREALQMAKDMCSDLVEIAPTVNPPVCKVIEYQKFLYEIKKKEKDKNKNATKSILKEIKLSPNIGEHDINFKMRNATEFLKEGNKIKVTLLFKGRGIIYKEQGELTLSKFAVGLEDVAKVEQLPKLEGKNMTMFLVPRKKG